MMLRQPLMVTMSAASFANERFGDDDGDGGGRDEAALQFIPPIDERRINPWTPHRSSVRAMTMPPSISNIGTHTEGMLGIDSGVRRSRRWCGAVPKAVSSVLSSHRSNRAPLWPRP